MKYLVLDTNILLKDINVIKRWSPQYKILIPKFIINELDAVSSRLHYNKQIFEIINNSDTKGFVTIVEPSIENDDIKQFRDFPSTHRLSDTDYLLFKYVQQLTKQGKDAILVSDDRALTRFAMVNGVNSMSLEGLSNLYSLPETTNIDFLRKDETIIKYQNRKMIVGFSLGVTVSIISYLFIENFRIIYSSASVWGTIVLVLVISFLFFLFRSKYRLQYGCVEYLFGFYIALRVFTARTFDYNLLEMIDFIQIVGGIYGMVRGLINVSEGIKGTLLQPLWNKIFRITPANKQLKATAFPVKGTG